MKFFLLQCFVLIAFFSRLDRYFFKENASFCPKYILPNWSRCSEFPTKPSKEVEKILQQPFHYLAKGKQCFVFVSEDQKWVLKLLRLPRYVMRYSRKGHASSIEFFSKTLKAFQWAYKDLPEETKILYAHLARTIYFSQKIELIDRYQNHYYLDPNDLPFALQFYGISFFSSFDSSKNQKELITKTIQIFSKMYDKKFIDRDPILDKNFGIIESNPFLIDVGQIEKCESLPSKCEYLEEMTRSLAGKLEKESPILFSYYKNLLH